MWTPTHLQLIVHRAKNLKCKGKAGTNDSYVTIQLGKEKYQTSIKERIVDPEWQEECDFPIPEQKSNIKIFVHHRNLLGLDEFLGHAEIPLEQFQVYERPRSRWFPLTSKPGSKKLDKYRGEIELTVTFMVQSLSGSHMSLSKSKKANKSLSFKSLAHTVGDKLNMKWPSKGSLSLKSGSRSDLSSGNFSAQSMLDLRSFCRTYVNTESSGWRMHANEEELSNKRNIILDGTENAPSGNELGYTSASQKSLTEGSSPTEVTKTLLPDSDCKDQASSLASLVEELSEDADSVLPTTQESITSSLLNNLTSSQKDMTGDSNLTNGHLLNRERVTSSDSGSRSKLSLKGSTDGGSKGQLSTEKLTDRLRRFRDGTSMTKFHTLGHSARTAPQMAAYELHEMEEYKKTKREQSSMMDRISPETLELFKAYEHDELVKLILEQKAQMRKKDSYIRDLEDYIDNLLVKVIETQPKLLQNPYEKPSAREKNSETVIPPSAMMAPGIYVTNRSTSDSRQTKTNGSLLSSLSSSKKTVTKSGKRQIIASPFKKLQALIK